MKNEAEHPLNVITADVIGTAIEVHRELGPGLLESIYRDCLALELGRMGMRSIREVEIPVHYKGTLLERSLRLDLLVENEIVVEVKAVECFLPVHAAQLLSYLRLARKSLGLLLNFNVVAMRQGIRRVVNEF
ncbi:MAG: hypothetical protein BWY57_02426 [Betaproteobacteria bacterium ADurb.Bin341]|nr:MAG: hypothetical protein BWY57_02426 [Betaproteobacteria bacterium ADurb.Bin341]